MRKSIVFLMALFAMSVIASCSNSDARLDDDNCWNELENGQSISGKIDLYYFKDIGTFALNKKCNPVSIGVNLDRNSKYYLDNELAGRYNKNIAAVHGNFEFRGKYLHYNDTNKRIIIIEEMRRLDRLYEVSVK